MKNAAVLLLILTMTVCALVGCNNGAVTTTPPPDNKPASITVVTMYGSDNGNRKHFETAVKDFEASTGNTIVDQSGTSNEEWKAKVLADFQTGSEPDVLFYFFGVDVNPFVEAGKVVSIDEIRTVYPEYATNMKDELLGISPVDGKAYAVPVEGYWESLFVNKKVLADCGVAVPGADYTWDQFMADCEVIKAKGYTPVACSLQQVPHYWFEFATYNNRRNVADHLTIPGTADDAAGEAWIAGLNDIKTMYEAGCFPQNTLTATEDEACQLIIENKAAFLIDGNWKVGFFEDNAGDRLDDFTVAYVPGKNNRKATDIIGGFSSGYFITKKAWDNPAKRDACVKLIEFMTRDELVNIFTAGGISALKVAAPVSEMSSLRTIGMQMYFNATFVIGAVQDGLIPEARSDLFANIKKIATGSQTAEAALEDCIKLQQGR